MVDIVNRARSNCICVIRHLVKRIDQQIYLQRGLGCGLYEAVEKDKKMRIDERQLKVYEELFSAGRRLIKHM